MLNSPCFIGVFGDFNGRVSGHIVLHEAKIILELNPRDVVFLLSSTITHEIIPISKEQSNAHRHTIVHYTAGGLYQWLWDGRKLHKFVTEKMSKDQGKERFKEMYNLLPSLEELKEASKTGFLSDHGIQERIRKGKSLLMHP